MKNYIKIIVVIALFLPLCVSSFSIGEEEFFFIEESYDYKERRSTTAELQKITDLIYFYVDKNWWSSLSEEKEKEYKQILDELGDEFKDKIYPKITSFLGDKPEHSINPNERIFVLFHPMQESAGGYFRTGDQYSKYQYARSNRKNILYLNSSLIEDRILPAALSHEYVHLVTFNEKDKRRGVTEEIWLNELRAETIPTILGYDDIYEDSNLESRVEVFLRDPDISITEWTEHISDYGVLNLFGQYLIDHYGKEILSISMKSKLVGIPSIDYALKEEGYDKSFGDVFTDFVITLYLNDCTINEYYCFKNENLRDLRVDPTNFFLLNKDEDKLSTKYQTKNWAGNWHRIVGSSGVLNMNFKGDKDFVIPYALCNKSGDCFVEELALNSQGEGTILVEEFNSKYNSLTIMPIMQNKFEGFNGPERTFLFNWEVTIIDEDSFLSKEELAEFRERIISLQKKIADIYIQVAGELPKNYLFLGGFKKMEKDLYFGMSKSREVENLQKFLKAQGEEIYPEGLITGNFYELTRMAVIRFQERHKEEILHKVGLSSGTGYVGKYTRNFINSLILK